MRDLRKYKGNFKFLIWAPSYNELSGGVIALHKLCHILNETGYNAFLQPSTGERHAGIKRIFYFIADRLPIIGAITGRHYKRNMALNTSLLPFGVDLDPNHSITIYPEIVDGNPLDAKHVVRWFLHSPGFHTGKSQYGPDEFHIDFNEFLKGQKYNSSYLSDKSLYVTHFPFDIFNFEGTEGNAHREGVAYCVRKGKIDPNVRLDDAVCIDGMSHLEAAKILKGVKYFFSFDPYTAYSTFAVLCGAISIVVPTPGMTKENWYANETNRYGIAFGMDDIAWAVSTQDLVLPILHERERASISAVSHFVEEVEAFFARHD